MPSLLPSSILPFFDGRGGVRVESGMQIQRRLMKATYSIRIGARCVTGSLPT